MVQLVDIVLRVGLQFPSASSVLPLALPLGSPGSVPWLAVSICICISQVRAEPLREQPYPAPVSKPFLASAIVWQVVVCRWDVSLGGVVSGWPFLQSLFHICGPVYPSDRNISGLKLLRCVGGPIPQMGSMPIYYRWSLQVVSPLFGVFPLKSSPLGLMDELKLSNYI